MSLVQPMFVSRVLFDEHELAKVGPFRWEHRGVVTAPGGERHVLTLLHRVVTNRAGERRGVSDHVLTRFAADGTPVRQVMNGDLPRGSLRLCGLPDGRFLVSDHTNMTSIVSADLASATLANGTGRWASRVRLTPSGRAVCRVGGVTVGVSDGPLDGAALPGLRRVTTLTSENPPWNAEPQPALEPGVADLGALIKERLEGYRDLQSLWDVVPIDDEKFIVTMVCRRRHLGERGGDFAFAVMDTGGNWLGHLDLDKYHDGAGRGFRYDVAVDPHRRVFHLNTFGLYVFDETGTRLLKLSTDEKEYKALKPFRLHEIDPAGNLVLVHEKQDLLVTVPVPEDLADLPGVVADALVAYGRTRTRLKKANEVHDHAQGWRWVADF